MRNFLNYWIRTPKKVNGYRKLSDTATLKYWQVILSRFFSAQFSFKKLKMYQFWLLNIVTKLNVTENVLFYIFFYILTFNFYPKNNFSFHYAFWMSKKLFFCTFYMEYDSCFPPISWKYNFFRCVYALAEKKVSQTRIFHLNLFIEN